MKECFTIANKEIVGWFTKPRFKKIGKFLGIILGIVGIIVVVIAALVFPSMWFLNQFDFNKTEYAVAGTVLCLFYFVIVMYLIHVHTVCKRMRIEEELSKLYEGYTIKWVSTMGYCTQVTLHNYSFLDVYVRAYEEDKVITVYDGDL